MQMQSVTSTNIRRIGYDLDTQTLRVEFVSGSTYDYAGVPPTVHENLIAASSPGQYFMSNIRNVYTGAKV